MTENLGANMNSTTTRRRFIKVSAAAGTAFSVGNLFAAKTVKPLRILILGGTGFTGPFQVRYALSADTRSPLSIAAKTHPGELPKEVEQLVGDRNGQLDALKNRNGTW